MRPARILIPSMILITFGMLRGQARSAPSDRALNVKVYMVRDLLTGGLEPTSADVVFRSADGKVTFSGTTDQDGHISVPVDFRGVRSGDRLEATIGSGSPLYFGAIVGTTPGRSDYELFLPPLKSMTRADSITVETGKH